MAKVPGFAVVIIAATLVALLSTSRTDLALWVLLAPSAAWALWVLKGSRSRGRNLKLLDLVVIAPLVVVLSRKAFSWALSADALGWVVLTTLLAWAYRTAMSVHRTRDTEAVDLPRYGTCCEDQQDHQEPQESVLNAIEDQTGPDEHRGRTRLAARAFAAATTIAGFYAAILAGGWLAAALAGKPIFWQWLIGAGWASLPALYLVSGRRSTRNALVVAGATAGWCLLALVTASPTVHSIRYPDRFEESFARNAERWGVEGALSAVDRFNAWRVGLVLFPVLGALAFWAAGRRQSTS